MKGANNEMNGIIPLSIREILTKLGDEQNKGNLKYVLKTSYLELYNETVNDLLDGNKKNLEIRESLQKGVFINGLTEIPVDSSEKVLQLLNHGENVRVIAETRLNDKSSRSHTIFRLSLEVTRLVDNKQKTFYSQLNLIDLAGSENVSKAKTDGLRMKEGSNINKSLLALSNVIHKLSSNPKSFVNYRDSKLTRLLQPALSGNSKTMIICTISDTSQCYSETLNTLLFGSKAKSIKTVIKVNEVLDEKNKIIQENTILKSKIKQLEELITENKSGDCIVSSNNEKNNSELISVLEKEVSILKKILINNEEVGESELAINLNENLSINSQNMSSNYNNNNSNFNHLLQSANKYKSSNMLISSGQKMTDSARKIYRRDDTYGYGNIDVDSKDLKDYNPAMNMNSNSIFRRCMTDMKNNSYIPGAMTNTYNSNNSTNYLLNTQQKNKYMYPGQSSNTNYLSSNFKPNFINPSMNLESEFDFLSPSNDNSMQLLKENDDLRKNLYELRKNFLETLQSRENQIKSLNYYLCSTNENCEKLIKEAEDNYINLKLNLDRTNEDNLNKNTEIKNLNQTIRNLEANGQFNKDEISRLNNEIIKMNESLRQNKFYSDLEIKLNDITKKYDALVKNNENDKILLVEYKSQYEKLKNENESIKIQIENHKSENLSLTTRFEIMKKNSEMLVIENTKIKNDIESYKSENTTCKDKINRLKSELNHLNKIGANAANEKKSQGGNPSQVNTGINNIAKIEELENKINFQANLITQLESQIVDYKKNLAEVENIQVVEYQKLLEESFGKIEELQNELEMLIQKNSDLENMIKLNVSNGCEKKLKSAVKETPLKEKKMMSNMSNKKVIMTKNENPFEVSQFSFVEKESITAGSCIKLKEDDVNDSYSIISSEKNDFIGKKRKHLAKVYRNILDKNIGKDRNIDKENMKD